MIEKKMTGGIFRYPAGEEQDEGWAKQQKAIQRNQRKGLPTRKQEVKASYRTVGEVKSREAKLAAERRSSE